MNDDIKYYLNKVENLDFSSISNETFETILDEGLDEELELYDQSNFLEAKLELLKHDISGLIAFDSDTVNKFCQFDWELKEKFQMTYIDFIDYPNGLIKIIKILKK